MANVKLKLCKQDRAILEISVFETKNVCSLVNAYDIKVLILQTHPCLIGKGFHNQNRCRSEGKG